MNFLGIVKGIGKGLGAVAQVAEPAISLFNPPLGALVGKVRTMVINAEAQIPEDGKGVEKHASVVSGFNEQLAMAQGFLKLGGKQMTYDAALLDASIKAEADCMNSYAALARSVKVIDIS